MYRSSLTLALVALCSTAAAASDLSSSVYVAPGGIYAPSADIYVRPGPAYRHPPYAESGYGYRQPYYGAPAYRAPAAVYGGYGPGYAERYYASDRYYTHDYAVEYAPRPPLPVPYYRPRCDDGYGGWTYCD